MPINLRRGVNISHWLSQSARRGPERRAWFTREDMRRIADLGLDHIRLPVDEVQLWDADGRRESEAVDLLSQALAWAAEAGLRVVVDLHILRSHHFNDVEEPKLYRDTAEQDRLAALWLDLAGLLSGTPCSQVAFELLNEPVAREDEGWNRVVRHVYARLRPACPGRTLIWGANRWNDMSRLGALWIPDDDRDLLIAGHFYSPMAMTHYRASWMAVKDYHGPVRYPGLPVDEADLVGVPAAAVAQVREWNIPWDRALIARVLDGALAVLRPKGLGLYLDEFGVIASAPDDLAVRWYGDVLDLAEGRGVAWAHWDYAGQFSVLDAQRRPGPRTAVVYGRA
jgi:endoglucanase